LKITKSDYYRNEMDISYDPGVALRLSANVGLARYVPYQLRDPLVSLVFRAGPPTGKKRRRTFPVDDLADQLDPSTTQKQAFWQKDFGVVMTHDVDTKRGYEYGLQRFVEIEKELDITSTFNLVPESLEYSLEKEVVHSLLSEGFDVGMHGLHHDGKFAYLTPQQQKERIEKTSLLAKDFGITNLGYRSPYLHRTRHMMRFLDEAGFAWDSSLPDTDETTSGYADTGCRSIFPFYPLWHDGTTWQRSRVVELPVSMPQDWTLLYCYRLSEEAMLKVWREKLDYIKSKKGLAVFITHPDPEDLGHPSRHKTYRALIAMIKESDPEWFTSSSLALKWKSSFRP
jgi:peptidoglycan/xylan/chitin deacetylase (PgdA/CDA1 family)